MFKMQCEASDGFYLISSRGRTNNAANEQRNQCPGDGIVR